MIRPQNEWIRQFASGKTFADVGGLWGTKGEKVTHAVKAGAAAATMVDIQKPDHHLWAKFHEHCEKLGVTDYECKTANLDDPSISQKIGEYELIHCNGIVYHCPNPIYTISQFTKICTEYLILGSAIVPDSISNEKGTFILEPGSAMFIPSLNQKQKEVVVEHFNQAGVKAGGLTIPLPGGRWNVREYGPWWWLFTADFLDGALEAVGFEILDSAKTQWGKGKAYLAKKR